MRNKLLITTVAAALVTGTVFAAAQEHKQGAGGATPSGGVSQLQRQQGTQEQRGALGQRDEQRTTGQGREESRESKQGQTHEKEGTARQGQRDDRNLGKQGQRGQLNGTTGQAEGKQGQNEERREGGQRNRPGTTTGQRPETQQGQSEERQQGREGREQRGGREGQVGERGVNEERGGNVSFTSEQRTRIRQSVLEGRSVPRVNSVDFAVSAGTVVPERIHVVTVPEVLVEYHPAWRGYFYFVVGDQIVIVDRRHRIVTVINV